MSYELADAAYQRGLDHFLRAIGDPLAQGRLAHAFQPQHVGAHLLTIALGVVAKDPTNRLLGRALSAARNALTHATDRERSHLAAARAWFAGDAEQAAARYTAVLAHWPRDLLALRLAQFCHFFLGQRTGLRAAIESVWPAWSPELPGYEHVLGMAAFAYAETGEPERAETLARQALALQPESPSVIHALAHALLERRDYRRGVLWMRKQEAVWTRDGRLLAHNAWHAAMFELECGNATDALALLDRRILPQARRSASDAADATALLWYLVRAGADAGTRWLDLSNCWAALAVPGYWPFFDLHAAIAFHAAGHAERARRLARGVRARADRDVAYASTARALVLPALDAVRAFSDGAHAEAATLLDSLAPALSRVGSHAQQALFELMLRDAQHGRSPRRGWPRAA